GGSAEAAAHDHHAPTGALGDGGKRDQGCAGGRGLEELSPARGLCRHDRPPPSFCAPYQAAMGLTSSSEKPLAMRSITVDGTWPDLNACMAATMSAGLRPVSRGTVVCAVRAAGWQPEQDSAPGGASAGPAAEACPIKVKTKAIAVTTRVAFMSGLPNARWRRLTPVVFG